MSMTLAQQQHALGEAMARAAVRGSRPPTDQQVMIALDAAGFEIIPLPPEEMERRRALERKTTCR